MHMLNYIIHTVKSAYNERPVIRNLFTYPNLYQGTCSQYVYKIKNSGYKEQICMVPMIFL